MRASVRPKGTVHYTNDGRIVLVTGGAQGIGWSICRAFAASGAKVVCADVAMERAADLPPGVEFRHTDTSDEHACRAVVEWTIDAFGGLDVLVNNASIQPSQSYTAVDALDSQLAERMVGVNFMGYTYMAKYALRQMTQQQSGVVINIASGLVPRPSGRICCSRCWPPRTRRTNESPTIWPM